MFEPRGSPGAGEAARAPARFEVRVLYGPSLFAAHPAVVLSWDEAEETFIPWPRLFATVTELGVGIDAPDLAACCAGDGTISRLHLVACLAKWLDRHPRAASHPGLMVHATRSGTHSAVAASFIDDARTAAILESAWGLADIVVRRFAHHETTVAAD